MKYETQKIALLYFCGALILFLAQVIVRRARRDRSTSCRICCRRCCRSTSCA